MNNVITPIYGSTGYATVNTVHPHRLSIFFILLASAISSEETSANLMMAERYSSLARAAFSLDPFVLHSTCATVQVLLMMIRFEFNWDPLTYETRWILTGLSSRISQVVSIRYIFKVLFRNLYPFSVRSDFVSSYIFPSYCVGILTFRRAR